MDFKYDSRTMKEFSSLKDVLKKKIRLLEEEDKI